AVSELWRRVAERFTLGPHSLHGPAHWKRVEEFGLKVAEGSGADPEVVRLFALFHDSCRESEGEDPQHGARGAELARAMRGRWFDLDDERFDLLAYACVHHTDGKVTTNPTVGTCWDADRLDLMRVGIRPVPRFLSTEAAKL